MGGKGKMGTHANHMAMGGMVSEMQMAVNVTRSTVIASDATIMACSTINAMRSTPPMVRD